MVIGRVRVCANREFRERQQTVPRQYSRCLSVHAALLTPPRAPSTQEPANTVAGSLGLANLDVLKFVPAVCAYPGVTFYNTLVIKTVVPLAVIALLWTRPLIYAVRSKPYAHPGQGAARISLLWMELVYVSVSTTIIQCFVCENIAGEGPRLDRNAWVINFHNEMNQRQVRRWVISLL